MRSALAPILLNSVPGWVRNAYPGTLPSLAAHPDEGRYWAAGVGQVSAETLFSTSRASIKYAQMASGLLVPIAVNGLPRSDRGALVEEARTNVVLWNRDLTNAAWTKTSITAALNQTGADGAANAATSLTATGANGTCLQAITLASAAAFQTAYVKRLTGSGTINMTMDNGVTWTPITVTAAYTQLSIPTQTLANPTVGFQIVTNGDTIAVDFVQNENGAFATSPILTTSASATRAADVIMLNGTASSAALAAQSIFIQTNLVQGAPSNARLMAWGGGARLVLATATSIAANNGAAAATGNLGSGTTASVVKSAFGLGAAAFTAVGNGGTKATQASAWAGNTNAVTIGSNGGGSSVNGYIARLAFAAGFSSFDGMTQ